MIKATTHFFLAFALLAFTSCGQRDTVQADDPQEVPEHTGETATYNVEPDNSEVVWRARKVTGRHHGTVDVQSGNLILEQGQIVGGRIIMDMRSITVDDLTGESKQKLEAHLKNDDFFDAPTHPTSTFEITNVELLQVPEGEATHRLTGNLIIKGISNSITVPAIISYDNGNIEATTSFTIDRKDWNILYLQGESFGDQMIYDDVTFELQINASRADGTANY